MGWKVKATTKPTPYEQALDEKEHGCVNEYDSPEELFSKMGI